MTIRPIRTMMNHNSTEIFFDNMVVPAENLVGEEGRGFRYILDGMNAERLLIAAECIGDAQMVPQEGHRLRPRPPGVRPADRAEPGHPVSAGARLRADARRRTDGPARAARNSKPALTPGEEANMAKLLAADASWAAGRGVHCRPMAASASPRNTTSSANSAKLGSTRWPRSAPT